MGGSEIGRPAISRLVLLVILISIRHPELSSNYNRNTAFSLIHSMCIDDFIHILRIKRLSGSENEGVKLLCNYFE